MSVIISLYSKLYMGEDDDSWCARPSRSLLNFLHGQEEVSARWIAVIGSIRIAVGDPTIGDTRSLYIPQWILEDSSMNPGEEIRVQFERCESIPKATRLGFKIIGDVPRDIDMRELLEEPLSTLGVLKEGQIIPAPVLEGVYLLVTICEPATEIFLDGAEIALEIEEEVQAQAQTQPSFESMLSPLPPPTGNIIPFSGLGRRLRD